MSYRHLANLCRSSLTILLVLTSGQIQTYAASNVLIRVTAANLTSGNNQRYESPGLNILKGLKPDIVAIQEFNYQSTAGLGLNTPAALREMVDAAFGTNFAFFRESGYAIPNGIISRYPFVASGSWVDGDAGVNDRGFAWARLDVPGTNDLYVVSVHLKASNTGNDVSRRAAELTELKAIVATNFPANAWIVVAGDFNIYSEDEAGVAVLASFLSDRPVPADQNGGTNTNQGRSERYDRVLVSFSLTNSLTPVVFPSRTFTNGLVFVSTNYTPLSDVPPVQFADSTASGMQHMGVVRDLRIVLPDTNIVNTPPAAPILSQPALTNNVFTFTVNGTPGTNYVLQFSTNLPNANWIALRTNAAPFSFSDSTPAAFSQRYFRAIWPP